ncbi:MAG: nuclear transport factor 2 family protein [Blastocatellia bacterium]|nr:nuclear transport factor 2 family protein [Blastocatellia bacterium]
MKQLTRILLLVIAMARTSSISSAQTKPRPTDEQALIALDRQWTAAELRLNDADRKTIAGIVADDYMDITPFGQVENKAQYMAALKHTEDTEVADEYVVRFFDGGKLAVMSHRGTVNWEANLPQHPRVGEARK